jgi:hypothetical protein
VKDFLNRRFWQPLLSQLKQGTTPEKIAWTVATGATISVFPILGATTGLCALVGIVLRMNAIVIQAANYLVTPLQIAAIPIFVRAGEDLFHLPHVSFNPLTLSKEFFAGPLPFLKIYGASGLAGVAVWILFAPFLILSIRALFLPFLNRKLKAEKAT